MHEIDGSGGEFLRMPAGGSRMPASHETVEKRLHYVHQEGQQVFKYAVRKMYEVCRDLLARNNLTANDIAVMIPHQANRRIITATAERLGVPCDRVIINIDRYGNTTSGTIPLATRDAIESGKLRKGRSDPAVRAWARATPWARACGAGRSEASCVQKLLATDGHGYTRIKPSVFLIRVYPCPSVANCVFSSRPGSSSRSGVEPLGRLPAVRGRAVAFGTQSFLQRIEERQHVGFG